MWKPMNFKKYMISRKYRYVFILWAITTIAPSLLAETKLVMNTDLLTTPERTQYQRTSTHAEVLSVVDALSQSEWVHRETLLTTLDGKDVPLLVLADPPIQTPEQARASGKAIIYIQGNIHGGEVEGKEASLMLMREIVLGEKAHLLQNQVLLFVPIFNADGNDRMTEDNRPNQDGSPKLAGERHTHGKDLNRDGIALETVENRALFTNLFNRWDPDVFIDLHTTNGTWHGYELTYAPSYQTAGDASTSEFITKQLFPAVTQTMQSKYGINISWFGDFDARTWPIKEFRTYHHAPRYITNQMGLRNRMAILSETFSHLPFYQRIRVAKAFVEEILLFTNNNAATIRAINTDADAKVVQTMKNAAGQLQKGVRYNMAPLDEPLSLRTYTHTLIKNEQGQTEAIRGADIVILEGVKNYNQFTASRLAKVPTAYVIAQQFTDVVENLRLHGIQVQILNKDVTFAGETFTVTERNVQSYQLNDHANVVLEGQFSQAEKYFRKGDFIVPMDQPLANLAFYLLEPESDDGLAFWNFFDSYFDKSGTNEYPVFKIVK